MNNKSFTLIELLVVIVIIGILAGVIMISTSSSIDKANIAKLKIFEESVANDLAANMVSRWKLDGNTNDSWGTSTGTAANITYTQGYDGTANGAAVFNGTSSYIDCGNASNLTSDYRTFSAWAKFNTISSNMFIVKKRYSADGDALEYRQETKSFRVSFLINSSWKTLETGHVLTINDIGKWFFVVGTYNGSYLRIYENGILMNSLAVSGKIDSNSYSVQISRDVAEWWNGAIDDVRIYDAALSSSQIKQNYIAGLDSLLSNGNISKEDYNQRINELAYE